MPKRKRMTVSYDRRQAAWTLKGAGEDGEPYEKKSDAVRRGALLGRESGDAQLVIKGKDGKIQRERTYGNDPRRSRG